MFSNTEIIAPVMATDSLVHFYFFPVFGECMGFPHPTPTCYKSHYRSFLKIFKYS